MQEEEEKTIDGLVDDTKEYLDTRVEYLRLFVVEKASKLFADLVTQTAVIVSFILAFLFGSITLALYLAYVFGSNTKGFGCVAFLYLLIAIIVFLTKDKYIEKGIVNFVITKYFKKHAEEAARDEKNV